ncbi:MAG TPA: hypothetical protein VFW25_05285 [Silvibacterium sp.]|nr:hypothetical protein [Silvibacterium sp.]
MISKREIDYGTAQNRNAVGDQQRHPPLADQNSHQHEIPEHGYQSI